MTILCSNYKMKVPIINPTKFQTIYNLLMNRTTTGFVVLSTVLVLRMVFGNGQYTERLKGKARTSHRHRDVFTRRSRRNHRRVIADDAMPRSVESLDLGADRYATNGHKRASCRVRTETSSLAVGMGISTLPTQFGSRSRLFVLTPNRCTVA